MSHGRADGPSQTGDVNNEAEHGVVADTETWSPSVLRGGPVPFHDLLLSVSDQHGQVQPNGYPKTKVEHPMEAAFFRIDPLLYLE